MAAVFIVFCALMAAACTVGAVWLFLAAARWDPRRTQTAMLGVVLLTVATIMGAYVASLVEVTA